MNALLFLNDQQRAVQHFPHGWSSRNLPGLDGFQSARLAGPTPAAAASSPASSRPGSGH
jgi:hypothetical protein